MFNRNGAMGLRLRCIEWDDDYSIGDDIIDLEHKPLLFSENMFLNSIQHRFGAERMLSLLEKLTKYAKAHFVEGEVLMSEDSYSGSLHHKTCSDGFLCAINAIKTQATHGDNILEELAYFIRNWVEKYVSKVDIELRPYIRGGGKNIGMRKNKRDKSVDTIIVGVRDEAFREIRRSANYVCVGPP